MYPQHSLGVCLIAALWNDVYVLKCDKNHLNNHLLSVYLGEFYPEQAIYPPVCGFLVKYRICVVWDYQQVLDIRLVCYLTIH